MKRFRIIAEVIYGEPLYRLEKYERMFDWLPWFGFWAYEARSKDPEKLKDLAEHLAQADAHLTV